MVATIETLADLCRQVGGDRIDVTSLSHGYQDPHFVEAKPSLVLTLNRADALVYVGLDLGDRLAPAAGAAVAEPAHSARAAGKHRRLDGDQGRGRAEHPRRSAARPRRHPPARQSALLDPAQERPRDRASVLAQRFTELDAAGAAAYQAGLAAFEHRLDAKEAAWDKAAAPLHGLHVVTYHKSWSYVAEWLKMQEVGYIEPKPGIPPTANHTAQLIELMRKSNVKLVIVESFYPSSLARFVAENGHARLVSAPSDVGAAPGIKTYFELVDAVIAAFVGGK